MSDVFADMQAALQQSAPTETAPPQVVSDDAPARAGEVTAEAIGSEPVRGEHGAARDAAGRFVPKPKVPDKVEIIDPSKPKVAAKPEVKPDVPKAEATKPAEEVKPPEAKPESAKDFKPPQAWKPAAREKLRTADPEIQAEVTRREHEMARFAQESAEERKFASSIKEAIRPFEAVLHVNGLDAPKAVNALLRTAYVLQTGTPQQKAQILAQEFKRAGIDEATFVAALDGTQGPAQGAPSAALPPEIQQVVQWAQTEQQRRAQEAEAAKSKQTEELQAFAEAHEFFDDLVPDMMAIAAAARQAGRTMSTEAVYSKAIAMQKADPDSEIGKVLRQRDEAEKAAKALASTQQARVAGAVSVKTQPAPAVAPVGGKTTYDDVQAAIASLSGK